MNNFEPRLYIRGGKILQLRDDGRVHDHCHVGNLGKKIKVLTMSHRTTAILSLSISRI